MGGEILIGYRDGRSAAFNEYGHRPWQKGYKDQERSKKETRNLARFQAEFARLFGRRHRSSSFGFHRLPPHEDSEEYHRHVLKRGN